MRESLGLVMKGKKTVAEFLGNYSITHRLGILKALLFLKLIKEMPPRTGSKTADSWLLYLMNARNLYRPQPYAGRVLQLLGDELPHGPGFDDTLGWTGTITGPLTVQMISDPDVKALDDPALTVLAQRLHAGLASLARTERALK